MIRLLVPLLLIGTSMLGACAPNSQNTVLNIREEQARSQQIVRQMDAKQALIKDADLNSYVNGLVARLAKHRPPGSVPLKVFLVKDADVNAFTTGGGYLFVNAGMLAAMENEAQLATVLAHEIGHIDRGHIQAQQSNRQLVGVLGAVAQIGAGLAGVDGSLTNLGIGLGKAYATNAYSRRQETDADLTGFQMAAAAGYNMVEGAGSFDVLRRLYGDKNGVEAAFFSSHPAASDRAAQLKAKARAEGYDKGRVGTRSYARATRKLRREALEFYQLNGRVREADQIRRNLRN